MSKLHYPFLFININIRFLHIKLKNELKPTMSRGHCSVRARSRNSAETVLWISGAPAFIVFFLPKHDTILLFKKSNCLQLVITLKNSWSEFLSCSFCLSSPTAGSISQSKRSGPSSDSTVGCCDCFFSAAVFVFFTATLDRCNRGGPGIFVWDSDCCVVSAAAWFSLVLCLLDTRLDMYLRWFGLSARPVQTHNFNNNPDLTDIMRCVPLICRASAVCRKLSNWYCEILTSPLIKTDHKLLWPLISIRKEHIPVHEVNQGFQITECNIFQENDCMLVSLLTKQFLYDICEIINQWEIVTSMWKSGFSLTVKYCEQAKRTNLCTFIDCPSAAKTTSTKLSLTSRESRTDTRVLWWLFHLRQNSWMSCWLPISAITHVHLFNNKIYGQTRRYYPLRNSVSDKTSAALVENNLITLV